MLVARHAFVHQPKQLQAYGHPPGSVRSNEKVAADALHALIAHTQATHQACGVHPLAPQQHAATHAPPSTHEITCLRSLQLSIASLR